MITTSGAQVSDGVALVETSGDALRKIVTEVSAVSGLVGEIADAAQKQASGITEISTMVMRMDEFTQRNAAMVEQSYASTQNLSKETVHLVERLGRFRLGGSSNGGEAAPMSMPGQSRETHRLPTSRQPAPAFQGNVALKEDVDDWSSF